MLYIHTYVNIYIQYIYISLICLTHIMKSAIFIHKVLSRNKVFQVCPSLFLLDCSRRYGSCYFSLTCLFILFRLTLRRIAFGLPARFFSVIRSLGRREFTYLSNLKLQTHVIDICSKIN